MGELCAPPTAVGGAARHKHGRTSKPAPSHLGLIEHIFEFEFIYLLLFLFFYFFFTFFFPHYYNVHTCTKTIDSFIHSNQRCPTLWRGQRRVDRRIADSLETDLRLERDLSSERQSVSLYRAGLQWLYLRGVSIVA